MGGKKKKSPKEGFPHTHKKQGEMFVTTWPPTRETECIALSLLDPCESWDILNFDSSVFALNRAFRFIKAGRGTQQSSLKHAWFNYFTQVCPGPWRFSSWRRLKLELKAGGGSGGWRASVKEGDESIVTALLYSDVALRNRNARIAPFDPSARLPLHPCACPIHVSIWLHAHESIGHD